MAAAGFAHRTWSRSSSSATPIWMSCVPGAGDFPRWGVRLSSLGSSASIPACTSVEPQGYPTSCTQVVPRQPVSVFFR